MFVRRKLLFTVATVSLFMPAERLLLATFVPSISPFATAVARGDDDRSERGDDRGDRGDDHGGRDDNGGRGGDDDADGGDDDDHGGRGDDDDAAGTHADRLALLQHEPAPVPHARKNPNRVRDEKAEVAGQQGRTIEVGGDSHDKIKFNLRQRGITNSSSI